MSDDTQNEIIKKLEAMKQEHAKSFQEIKTQVGEIDSALRGTYEKQGALTRIATLERSEKMRCRITMAAVTAAVGSAVSALLHLTKGAN
jgi:hypothetical protein